MPWLTPGYSPCAVHVLLVVLVPDVRTHLQDHPEAHKAGCWYRALRATKASLPLY